MPELGPSKIPRAGGCSLATDLVSAHPAPTECLARDCRSLYSGYWHWKRMWWCWGQCASGCRWCGWYWDWWWGPVGVKQLYMLLYAFCSVIYVLDIQCHDWKRSSQFGEFWWKKLPRTANTPHGLSQFFFSKVSHSIKNANPMKSVAW